MNDVTLSSRNALHGATTLVVPGQLEILVAPELARFSLRIAPADLAQASAAFGAELPARVGVVERAGSRLALCLGPDEWSLLADEQDSAVIEALFAPLETPHSLVNVSHRELGIIVRGPAATAALGAICARNLAALPVGGGTRTILDRAQVVLLRNAEDEWRIEIWQSFAAHIWGLLAAVVTEYRAGI